LEDHAIEIDSTNFGTHASSQINLEMPDEMMKPEDE